MNTPIRNFHRWPYAAMLASRQKTHDLVLTQDAQTLGRELCVAIFRGENRIVQELISLGAPLNHRDEPDGWTPLIYAIYYDQPAVRSLLLSAGADPKVTDFAGRTTLMFAAIADNPQLISELIGSGVPVDAVDHRGKSALDFAEEYRNGRCAALLNRHLGRRSWNAPLFNSSTTQEGGQNE